MNHTGPAYVDNIYLHVLMIPFPKNLQKFQTFNIKVRLVARHIVDLRFALLPVLLDIAKAVETYPKPSGGI